MKEISSQYTILICKRLYASFNLEKIWKKKYKENEWKILKKQRTDRFKFIKKNHKICKNIETRFYCKTGFLFFFAAVGWYGGEGSANLWAIKSFLARQVGH